jgi:hypothetical protein
LKNGSITSHTTCTGSCFRTNCVPDTALPPGRVVSDGVLSAQVIGIDVLQGCRGNGVDAVFLL